jgi:hypothetical protein
MPNRTQTPLTPRGRLAFGLIFVAFGIAPMLATFDIGPLSPRDINGPAWLGVAAGGVFVAAGLAVIAGPERKLINSILVLLVVSGLAAIGNWIAFGVGERVCGASILIWTGTLSGLGCRIPFGIGALITNGFLLLLIVIAVQTALGGPPRLARLRRVAENVMLITLAPILLPFLFILFFRGAGDALKTRLRTGEWPRNEAFIARTKAARAEKQAPD